MATEKWIRENQEKLKEYRRTYYKRNNTSEKTRIRNRVKDHLQLLRDLKKTLKCNRCPESHPATLHFHHINPSNKNGEIGKLIARGWSWERVLDEISKCEVLCANCHSKEHYTGVV